MVLLIKSRFVESNLRILHEISIKLRHCRSLFLPIGIYFPLFFAHVLARRTAAMDSTATQERWIVAAKSESFIR